jgi:hypothetical protein
MWTDFETGYAPYFNWTFANEIYYYGLYFYETYFYGSILLQAVYTSPWKILLETLLAKNMQINIFNIFCYKIFSLNNRM